MILYWYLPLCIQDPVEIVEHLDLLERLVDPEHPEQLEHLEVLVDPDQEASLGLLDSCKSGRRGGKGDLVGGKRGEGGSRQTPGSHGGP